MRKNDLHKQLINLLKELHLPMFREYYEQFAQKAIAEDMGYAQYLFELAQRECEVRKANSNRYCLKGRLLTEQRISLPSAGQAAAKRIYCVLYATGLPGRALLLAPVIS